MDKCVDKLKCSICNNPLSYFPIYLSLDKKNVCGRCESNTKTSPTPVYIRNKMYEIVAQFLKFPCRYQGQGCGKTLIPSEIPTHEKLCTFRVSLCPTASITKCVVEVPNRDLIQHCQEKHSDLILEDYHFKIDLSQSYETKNLLIHEDTLFVVTNNFYLEDNTFECFINILENEDNSEIYSYQINLTNDERTFSVNYAVDDCKNKKICLDVFKNCNKYDDCFVILGEITIQNTNSHVINYKRIHDQLLSQMKCSKCKKYLTPHGTKCCESESFSGTGELRLIKITRLLNYPCSYQKNGCNFTSRWADLKDHETFCPLADCECPINEYVSCTWKGLSNEVVEHVKKDHDDLIVQSTHIFKFLNDSRNCYIIKFSNRLFRLVFIKNVNESYYIWSLQLIGPFAEQYKYEIEIVGEDDNRKLQARQPCPLKRLIKKNEILQYKTDYSYFYNGQIEFLGTGQYFTFKVHILT